MSIEAFSSRFDPNSLRLQRQLQGNQLSLERTLERLSSGLRLNRAADDPPGFALARKVETRLRSTRTAIDGTQQGSLLTATASDGAQQILASLQRIRELSIISLNETQTDADRRALETELGKLVAFIDRVARNTFYNQRSLLDGGAAAPSLFQSASSEILINELITDNSVSPAQHLPFIAAIVSTDATISTDQVISFRLFASSSSNGAGIEISSSRLGLITINDNYLSFPTTYGIPITGLSSGPVVTVDLASLGLSAAGPLTAAELGTVSLQQLVDDRRLNPISYGPLNLSLGGVNYNNILNVSPSHTVQDVIDAIDGLAVGSGSLSASFDPITSRISVAYDNQRSLTRANTVAYNPAVPAGFGSAGSFAGLGAPAEGPAYRDITPFLPPLPFSNGAPPAGTYFPTVAGFDTSLDFTGSGNILAAFGLSSAASSGTIENYTIGSWFGETVATPNQSEFVNRTRLTISDATSAQDVFGSDTGLSLSDAGTSFRVLNTAKVSDSDFAAGNFTIDFGSNGVFDYNAVTGSDFDPDLNSIQDVLDAITTYATNAGVNVVASFDDTDGNAGGDTLTITNTPDPGGLAKVTDPGLVMAAGTFTINFGSNGVFDYQAVTSTPFDPNLNDIQDIVSAINTFGLTRPGGGSVRASYDAASDQLTIDNIHSEVKIGPGDDPNFAYVPGGQFQINFAPGVTFDSTIDFLDFSTGTLGAFDPNLHTIEDVVESIRFFAASHGFGGMINAQYDEPSDRLRIDNNLAMPMTEITYAGPNGEWFRSIFGLDFISLSPGNKSVISNFDVDYSTLSGVGARDVNAGDYNLTPLAVLTQPLGGDNSIRFGADAYSQGIKDFFQLSDVLNDPSSHYQRISSAGDIDNSNLNPSLDISAGDVNTATLTALVTPIAPGDNRIVFGGANGANIADFFNLNPNLPDDGSGLAQSVSSFDLGASPNDVIHNGSLDASLRLDAADLSRPLAELYTPKLATLVSGPLVINGQTILTIDPDSDTINSVLAAINAFSPGGGRDYGAGFDATVSGGLNIRVRDTEVLSAPGSTAPADPGGFSPTVNGNELSLDSAAYIAANAPLSYNSGTALGSGSGPAEQPVFGPVAPTGPYSFLAPDPTGLDISGISFSGSNIASVLYLSNVASGTPTLVAGSSEYRGIITPTAQHSYDLAGELRQSFSASSSTSSSQAVGYIMPTTGGDDYGIVAQLYVRAGQAASLSDKALSLQIGPDAGDSFRLGVPDLTAASLRLEGLSLIGSDANQTRLRGLNVLSVVDDAIATTLATLGGLAASQNILESALDGLGQSQLNLSSQLSGYEDADISSEIGQMTRAQINVQAAASALREQQLNQQRVFELLFGVGEGRSELLSGGFGLGGLE